MCILLSLALGQRIHFFLAQSTKSVALLMGQLIPGSACQPLITRLSRQQAHGAPPETPVHECPAQQPKCSAFSF